MALCSFFASSLALLARRTRGPLDIALVLPATLVVRTFGCPPAAYRRRGANPLR